MIRALIFDLDSPGVPASPAATHHIRTLAELKQFL